MNQAATPEGVASLWMKTGDGSTSQLATPTASLEFSGTEITVQTLRLAPETAQSMGSQFKTGVIPTGLIRYTMGLI